MRAADQTGDSQKRPRRKMLVKVSPINAVEFPIQTEVRAVHRHRDQIIHLHALALEHSFHALHREPSFFLRVLRQLASLVKADASPKVKRVSHNDGIAKWKRGPSRKRIQNDMLAI